MMKKLLSALKKSRLTRSSVAILLAFSVLLSTFAGISILAADSVWDGTEAIAYESGTGTQADPFIIANGAQLYKLAKDTETDGKFYKLTKDIYLNDTQNVAWAENMWTGAVSINDATAPVFRGTLDGAGHKVYGLAANIAVEDTEPSLKVAIGLFPLAGAGATVKNLGIEDANLSITNAFASQKTNWDEARAEEKANRPHGAVGAIFGYLVDATTAKPVNIAQCYADEDTVLYGAAVGLVGATAGCEVNGLFFTNCYITAAGTANTSGKKDTETNYGFDTTSRLGILGTSTPSRKVASYAGCYSVKNIAGVGGNTHNGGKTSYAAQWGSGVANSCSEENMKGEAAKNNMPLLDWNLTYKTTSKFPVLRVFEAASELPPAYDVWNGKDTGGGEIKGKGTDAEPFLINNGSQLAWVLTHQMASENSWPVVKIMADIYLNDLSAINWSTGEVRDGYEVRKWKPGSVHYQIDGNGHMIYGLYVDNAPTSYFENGSTPAGLIGSNYGGNKSITIKNLGMDNLYIHTDGAAGAFIGKAMGASAEMTLNGCYLGPNATLKGYDAGAFIGYGPAIMTIQNSANLASNMICQRKGGSTEYSGFLSTGVWDKNKKIENSYSVTKLFVNGGEADAVRTNSYAVNKFYGSDVVVSAANMQGYDALTNASKMPNLGTGFKTTSKHPVPAALYEAVTGYWGGGKDNTLSGSGSETSPWLITSAAEFAYVLGGGGAADKFYKIMTDIYLNDPDAINWATGEVKAGYTANKWVSTFFRGTLDGNGHTVYGMYIEDNPSEYTENGNSGTGRGLISDDWYNKAATLKNLGIDKAYVHGAHSVAAFVANTRGVNLTIDGCYTGAEVTLKGYAVGSFIGYGSKPFTVSNSLSITTNMTSKIAKPVGMIGNGTWTSNGSVKKSFAVTAVLGNNGPVATDCYAGVATHGISATALSDMKMERAKAYMPKLDWDNYFVTTNGYPTLKAFAELPVSGDVVWNGGKDNKLEGTGTENDPWLISSAQQFAYVMGVGGAVGKYYKLTNDIYLNDITKIDWVTGEAKDKDYVIRKWTPNYFRGTIDGDGHTVYGLYAVTDKAFNLGYGGGFTGLISENFSGQNVDIKNFGLDYAYVAGAGSSGALIGYAKGGTITIDRTYVGANVTVRGHGAAGFIGAGGTGATVINISNSYSLVTRLEAIAEASGMLGYVWNGTKTIRSSYAVDKLYSHASTSVLKSYAGVATNPTDAVLAPENMKGMDALTNKDKLYSLSGAFTATEGYPELCIFADIDENPGPAVPDYVWDGSKQDVTKGTGSKDNPYLIENAEQFAKVMGANGKQNTYYKLTADIYLNEPSLIDWETGETKDRLYDIRYWNPTFFAGTIDGNGHMVYGMYVDKPFTEYVEYRVMQAGLITENWWSCDLTVKNLGIDKAYVKGGGASAAILAYTKKGSATIDRCFVGEDVTVHGNAAAAVIATGEDGKIVVSNCYSLTERITGNTAAAAIMANPWCSNKAIATSYAVGKLFDKNAPIIATSYATVASNAGETVVSPENMKGDNALTNENKMPLLGGAFYATDSYPKLAVFDGRTEPMPPVFDSDIWDGSVTEPAEGKGTVMEPYLISNGSELAWALSGSHNGKYYRLTKDIKLNDVTAIDWNTGKIIKPGYIPRVWKGGNFNGVIEGDAHHIYGLYINQNATSGKWSGAGVGLIAKPSGDTTIEKLGIDHAYVNGAGGVSAFFGAGAGTSGLATINECFVGSNVTLYGYLAGGFTGVSSGGVAVKNSYSLILPERLKVFASVSEKEPSRAGGVFGDTFKYGNAAANTISNVYSIAVPFTNRAEASSLYTQAADAQGAVTLTAANMKGLDALSNANKMPKLGASFKATNGYPVIKVFADGLDYSTVETEIWSGKIARTLKGSGTEADPYLIENGAELAFAVTKGGFGGAYFKLTKDIYLNEASTYKWVESAKNEWYSDFTFTGHLDGDGHIVYGLYYPENNMGTSAGLIPVMAGGSIKNIGVRYANVVAHLYAGGIVGSTSVGTNKEIIIDKCFADDTCTIKFIATKATHSSPYGGAGGILGYANATPETLADGTAVIKISNSYAKVVALASVGAGQRNNGIIGTAWGSSYQLTDCYSFNSPAYFGNGYGTASKIISKYTTDTSDDAPGLHSGVYTTARQPDTLEEFTLVDPFDAMFGDNAKIVMPELDYENVFECVLDSTPKLKIFTSISGKATDMSGDAEVFSSGSGTRNDPYIIMNEAQLRHLIESKLTKNKFYALGADLYLNDTTKANWMVDNPSVWYNPLNHNTYGFEGTIDGKGYIIYGLYSNYRPLTYEEAGKNYVSHDTGLFPTLLPGATVRNIHIRNSFISGSGYAGAIAGFISGGGGGYATIIGCSADETVTVKGQTAGGLVGGGTRGLKLYYSYFTGKLDATQAAAGRMNALVGDIWNSDQEAAECYSVGYTNYRPGYQPGFTMSVYATKTQAGSTTLTLDKMLGEAAKKNMDLSWDTVWYTVEGKTPQLKVIPADMKLTFTDEGEKGRIWSGKLASKFASGKGTAEDPYIIETPEQLAYLVTLGANKTLGKHFKLGCDIKVNDTSYSGWENEARNWITGGMEFGGHLDGDGHVISGLYYNGNAAQVALFPKVTGGCFIEKVGVTDTTFISNVTEGVSQTYVATFGAFYGGWTDERKGYNYPRVSQCFASDTVYLEGLFAGGMFNGTPKRFEVENCYFTGEVYAEDHQGTMFGTIWGQTVPSSIKNSFSASAERGKVASNNGLSLIEMENYYHDGAAGNGAAKTVGLLFMKGETAKQYMSGLDYVNIWKTVSDGTPVLRCFKDAEKYSCRREPAKVEIAFVTGDGSACEPIYGYPGYDKITKDMLPVPTRYGFDFGGWYYFAECDLPFDLEIFPEYDCYLYAKWIQRGFEQGFEGKIDEKYDFNEGAQLFKPGVAGYNPRFVHGGLRSAHTLGNGTQGIFLLSYDNMLNVGNKYDITIWVNTATENAKGVVELLHANHGQVDSDIVGYESIIDLEGIKKGVWTKYKVSIVANAPFLLVRTPADVELFFDDIQVVDTAEKGELGQIDGFNPGAISGEPGSGLPLVWLIVIIAGGVILLGGIATTVVILVKKNKKTA